MRDGGSTCVRHSVFLCSKCLSREVDRLNSELGELKLSLAAVGNIIGAPTSPGLTAADAKSRFYCCKERAERIERAVAIVAKVLGGQGGDLRERLADLCHSQWSGWMVYLFSKCAEKSGALVLPPWAVERWTRQMNTPFRGLTNTEQESDRHEADKFLAIFDEQVRA